jgi:iron-sulfur cluster assembly accessory protein
MGLQFRRQSAYVPTMGQFAVTERAAARIAEIAAAEGNQLALRVSVLAGGCSGFQYRFELDKDVQPDDLVIEKANAKIVVDPSSLDLLAGSELDFTDALMGSHFAVRNPNATSSCGCGTSFSIE